MGGGQSSSTRSDRSARRAATRQPCCRTGQQPGRTFPVIWVVLFGFCGGFVRLLVVDEVWEAHSPD